jgi:uncharacterized protein YutE (UPF0331/DUF86 family)
VEFDKIKINQKILFMEGNLFKLNKLKALNKEEFINDFRNCDSAKYLLQVTIEAMLDIASHLIARNRWGKPENNKEHFKILADNGISEENTQGVGNKNLVLKYIKSFFIPIPPLIEQICTN